MKKTTFCLGGAVKLAALALAVLGVSISADAAAWKFVYNGIAYKTDAKNTYAIVDHPTTKPNKGEITTPLGDYTGDIVIPTEVECEGKTLPVQQVSASFHDTSVESVYIPDGIKISGKGLFKNCTKLKSVRFPKEYDFGQGAEFQGCTALEEYTVPASALYIDDNNFKNCISLRKIVFEESEDPVAIAADAFSIDLTYMDGENKVVYPSQLVEVEIYRPINMVKYTEMANKPFRNHKAIQKLTIAGKCTQLPASYFSGASKLTDVTIADTFTSFGTNCFEGTPIAEFTLPAGVTSISASCFQGCKELKKVTLHADVKTIADMAFYNSAIEEINFNEGLTSIGQMAFANTHISGALALPSTVASIGIQAFANNNISGLTIPAATTTIGNGAFMNCPVSTVTVDAANTTFASSADNTFITINNGASVKYYAPAAAATSFEGNYTAIEPYAFYGAKNLESINLPNCAKYGDYCFYGSGIKTLKVGGEIGRYVAANCTDLTSLTVDSSLVPFAIAYGNTSLTDVTLRPRTSTIQQDAFNGCTSLKNLNLGLTLSILESDCFAASGITNLTVCAPNPASMSEGVFKAGDEITVNVPVDLVDAYKNADGWSYLNIAGDANLAQGPSDMGMPHGLYYAGTDKQLHCVYSDGETDTYDVGGIPHTFQLLEYSDRIYGACAGEKFWYSNTGSVDGDGKLFYISKVGGDVFQATVLDNTDGNAYADPFGLYEHQGILYVNDRNVSIRKIPASALALPKNYPSWMENNWLGYYGHPWAYGCIKAGFNITVDPEDNENIYWVGMKYNGEGLFCFKDADIHPEGPIAEPEAGRYFEGLKPIFTTFQIDKKNNHLYMYIEKAGDGSDDNLTNYVKGGLYRFDLDVLKETPNPSFFSQAKPLLVDGSPVKYEGAGTNEHIGISQLAIDENNEYMYWCYRAPSAAEAETNEAQNFNAQTGGKYWWADKYDAANPLHQSGIKRIKLGEENPVVEMVVPGVEGYGVAPVKYEGSKKSNGVEYIIAANVNDKLKVQGDAITVESNAKVVVYSINGMIVAYNNLAAGETMSVANLESGVYVVVAAFDGGRTATAKIVK